MHVSAPATASARSSIMLDRAERCSCHSHLSVPVLGSMYLGWPIHQGRIICKQQQAQPAFTCVASGVAAAGAAARPWHAHAHLVVLVLEQVAVPLEQAGAGTCKISNISGCERWRLRAAVLLGCVRPHAPVRMRTVVMAPGGIRNVSLNTSHTPPEQGPGTLVMAPGLMVALTGVLVTVKVMGVVVVFTSTCVTLMICGSAAASARQRLVVCTCTAALHAQATCFPERIFRGYESDESRASG